MSQFTDADQALDRFIVALAECAVAEGWTLVRFHERHTDRSFELRGDGCVSPFTAKISLTEKAFWGLSESKANEIAASQREHLLLLIDARSGRFLSNVAFQRLLPKFSRTLERAVRINPNIIKAEMRFATPDEAFDLLKARSFSPAV